MGLTKRQKLLASILLKQKGTQTIKNYASQLNISERTVHADLKKIEEYLRQEGYQLIKRPGIGVEVKKNKENKIPGEEKKLETTIYSTEARREKIIQLLLFENQTVTFDSLSEIFLISKTSIKNDLDIIKKNLTTGNKTILISDAHGTRLEGTEIEIQNAYLKFNNYLVETRQYLFEPSDEKKWYLLNKYYGETIVRVSTRVLYSYIKEELTVIAEHYISTVLNRLIVLVYRASQGFHIDQTRKIKQLKEQAIFEKSSNLLLDKIGHRLSIHFTKEDSACLSEYLLSNRFEPLDFNQRYDQIVVTIIEKMSESIAIDFTKDKKLSEQLKLHIPPMIYRLKQGIQTNNPFIDQIKNEFTLIFNLIWVVLSEYEEELGIVFNEDEIGFLAIYFQSAIERAKVSKKILIVCPTGIATSELLLNRIKNILPAFTTIEVASIKEVNDIDLEKIDLIISTVNLDVETKLIVVSPLLTNQDIKNISTAYNEQFTLSKKNQGVQLKQLDNLRPYLFEPYIFWDESFQTKETLLDEIGQRLFKANLVDESFIASIQSRERLGGTDLPTGVAIPHGKPKYVKKTMVAIVKNKRYLKWNDYSVNTVLIVCVAEKDRAKIKGILSDIYSLVERKETIMNLHEVLNFDQ